LLKKIEAADTASKTLPSSNTLFAPHNKAAVGAPSDVGIPERKVTPLPKVLLHDMGFIWREVLPYYDSTPLTMLQLAIQAAYLKQSKTPISLLLIGKPGIGKTRLLSPTMRISGCYYTNDITPKYLVDFLEKAKRGEKKLLVIPDFLNATSHAKKTRETLIAMFRSMTEEGIQNLDAFGLEFHSEKPVRAGLITATTEASSAEFRERWKNSGFLSRMLPFSFNHTPATQEAIMATIDRREPDPLDKVRLPIVKHPKQVAATEEVLAQLRDIEERLAKETGALPYRHQLQLTAIAEAHAVLRGGISIEQEDINAVRRLSYHINYRFEAI
jgi:hypothetical protein